MYLPNQFVIVTLLHPDRHSGEDGLQVLGGVYVVCCILLLHGHVDVVDARGLNHLPYDLTSSNL